MNRDIIDKIALWKEKPGRKPLLLQGARQVGKSWALREAGRQLFENTVILNMDRDADVRSLFDRTKDPRRLVEQISLVKGEPIREGTSLLVIDEIQECDAALAALKYFREEMPGLAVAAAGSLLGVALKRGGMSFPVGQVEFMSLYPMSFSEFLGAVDSRLRVTLDCWDIEEPLPEALFNQLSEKYKLYLAIGGMPEVVGAWINSGDMVEVDAILDSITRSYQMDFSKFASPGEAVRIYRLWNNVGDQLAKENKKFKYALIDKGARAREYESIVSWLELAGLVYRVSNTQTIRLPLSAYKDNSAFKLYLHDVGVLRHLFGLDAVTLATGNRLFVEFKGIIAENQVLNSLVPQLPDIPLYWTSGNQAEVEFVSQVQGGIVPMEVKSSTNVQAKSLKSYRERYSPPLSLRFSLRNLHYSNGLQDIPLFFADRTLDIINVRLAGTIGTLAK